MRTRLIIDGNAVYEIDEECVECQKRKKGFPNRLKKQETETSGNESEDRKKE